ncbi:MAG: PadR family transcriptional regulator [Candidatus Cloacimonetes bacterium]|nr:PadR family transcriptional regulator [Candidatus Cloacimonadota bacterium]
MSKIRLVALGFLNAECLYGYKIGQLVEQYGLPFWSDINLASIYKALTALEKAGYTKGMEQREGNNPPRMVYQITNKGKAYLQKLVKAYLSSTPNLEREWWLALFFGRRMISKEELSTYLDIRIAQIKELEKTLKEHSENQSDCPDPFLSFIFEHQMSLGERFLKAEHKNLLELATDISANKHDDYFRPAGDKLK